MSGSEVIAVFVAFSASQRKRPVQAHDAPGVKSKDQGSGPQSGRRATHRDLLPLFPRAGVHACRLDMLGRCRVLAAVAAGVMWLVLCLSTLETSGTAVRGGIEPDQTGRPGPFDSRSPIALFYPYGKNG